jgi:hypothetical protein
MNTCCLYLQNERNEPIIKDAGLAAITLPFAESNTKKTHIS